MDPELLAKLSLRLRKVEGDSAQMPQPTSSTSSAADLYKTPGKLNASRFSRQSSEETLESANNSPRTRRGNRVRVPDWVVEGAGSSTPNVMTPRFRSTASWPGAASSSSGPKNGTQPSVQGTPEAEEEAETALEHQLWQMQKERDLAMAQVLKAQASADHWRDQLTTEAVRLKDTWEELRQKEEASERQANRLRCAGGEAEDADDSSSQLEQLHHQIRQLGMELFDLGQEKSALSVQSMALAAELERQEEECRQLVGDCEGSQTAQERLQSELEEVEVGGLSVVHAMTSPAGGAGTSRQSTGSMQDVDLEFSHDFALDLSGRMSIQRALRLAQHAGRRRPKVTRSSSRPLDEDPSFDIAELMDALKVLQMANAEAKLRSPRHQADSMDFSESIAQLQEVVEMLSGGGEKKPTTKETLPEVDFDQSIAELHEVVNLLKGEPSAPKEMSSASKSKDRDLGGSGIHESYEDSIANLQEVVEILKNGAQAAGTAVEAAGRTAESAEKGRCFFPVQKRRMVR
eukprot:s3455_g4.t2